MHKVLKSNITSVKVLVDLIKNTFKTIVITIVKKTIYPEASYKMCAKKKRSQKYAQWKYFTCILLCYQKIHFDSSLKFLLQLKINSSSF